MINVLFTPMKSPKRILLTIACVTGLVAAGLLYAAESKGAKSYQVTGPVLEITPSTITVQKGDDKWQLERTSSTKVSGELKTGAKVTIYYKMVAEEVEVKDGKAKK